MVRRIIGAAFLMSSLAVADAQDFLRERVEEHLLEVERYRNERHYELPNGRCRVEYPSDDELEIMDFEIIYLTEEEVLGWTEMESDSLLDWDEYLGVDGFNWCGIYECMSRDSFACIPFDEELYCNGWGNGFFRKKHMERFEKIRKMGVPVCDCPLEDLILVYYNSPKHAWKALVGREGLLPICRKHKRQLMLKVWKMS